MPLAVPIQADAATGLHEHSHAMAWLPTTVLRALHGALDLEMLEPWQGTGN